MSLPSTFFQKAAAHTSTVVFLFLFTVLCAFAQETQSTEEVQPLGQQETSALEYTTEFITSATNDIPGDFVVGPGKTELQIAPGETKIVEIIVTNRMGEAREFRLEVEDASGSQDPQIPVVLLGEDRGPYTLRDYLAFPAETLLLAHNERARIPVRVSVPADAEPGGRYGSVLVTTVSKKAQLDESAGATPSSAIISRVGTLFFLTVPGATDIEGELQHFDTVAGQTFFSKGPVSFQMLYENKGVLHLNPYGEIRISNIFNEEVGFIEVDPWFALPHSLRSREVSWNRELLIGKYTATAHINRGYDDIIDTQSVTFWVLPWQIIVPIFITLFIIFFLIRFALSNFEFKRKSS